LALLGNVFLRHVIPGTVVLGIVVLGIVGVPTASDLEKAKLIQTKLGSQFLV
jgi:hypothetical protein